MSSSYFTIPGPPVAKERPRRSANGSWYTPKKTVEYERGVAAAAEAAGVKLEPLVPYELVIILYVSRFNRDLDNMSKSIQDGLMRMNQGWDDKQVHSLNVKLWPVTKRDEEKAFVSLKTIAPTIQNHE